MKICIMIEIYGFIEVEEISEIIEEFSVIYERWYMNYAEIILFLEDLEMHSWYTFQILTDELYRKIIHSIENYSIRIIKEIINIQMKRNHQNNVDNDLSYILPHEFIKLSTHNFENTIIDIHLQQLQHSWNEETITEIENEYK